MKNLLKNLDKNSIYLGIQKGYNVAILPTKVYKIYNLIYIRMLRFIGGICLLLILTKATPGCLPVYVQRLILILALLQSVSIVIIFIIKIIYGFYTLKYKSDKFEVRNSPLNQYATHIARVLYCAKIGCAVTGGRPKARQ